jgi:hypothetical protein
MNFGETVRVWLAGLIGLGALYIVGTHGAGIGTALKGAGSFLSTSEGTVLRGGA